MKHRGDTNELRFILLYHELGYTISKPIGDNAKYDVIVDNGINLEKIQIKSTTRKDIHKGSDAYCCLVCHGSTNKITYTKNDVDFIAIYVIPEKTWYKIPVEEIKGKNVRLYPHRSPYTNMYEKYRLNIPPQQHPIGDNE